MMLERLMVEKILLEVREKEVVESRKNTNTPIRPLHDRSGPPYSRTNSRTVNTTPQQTTNKLEGCTELRRNKCARAEHCHDLNTVVRSILRPNVVRRRLLVRQAAFSPSAQGNSPPPLRSRLLQPTECNPATGPPEARFIHSPSTTGWTEPGPKTPLSPRVGEKTRLHGRARHRRR